MHHDPLARFTHWLDDARATPAISEPTAMTLATATPDGVPSARIVLLKEHGPEGFLFYTNLTSRKSRELAGHPQAAVCFYWMPLERQVRIEGALARATRRPMRISPRVHGRGKSAHGRRCNHNRWKIAKHWKHARR